MKIDDTLHFKIIDKSVELWRRVCLGEITVEEANKLLEKFQKSVYKT